MSKILFWTGFGLFTRFWQLGLEMRPFFNRESLWAWPLFGGIGASFGYWMEGVSERQEFILYERKQSLLAKRARKAFRENEAAAKVAEEESK